MMNAMKGLAVASAVIASASACSGGDTDSSNPLSSVDAIVILQRPARNDIDNIFDYTNSYIPGAKLIKLEPPTADGTVTVLCCDKAGSDYANIDISGYDISFDAQSIVFAGRLAQSEPYSLFILKLADGSVTQIAADPTKDYITPIFLPDNKVMFETTDVVEPGAPQHMDEYERATTTQVGTVNVDGTDQELGPRNLSHRIAPALASDGRVIFTQWDHLGESNAGHLMFMNTDMTELREAFGKEGHGASNSTLKALEIAPGRFIGIATSRDKTLNAGALLDIRLGIPSTDANGNTRADSMMSEANSSYVLLSPQVPLDNSPSSDTVGRYYDAFPLNQQDKPALLVSWADGPVETTVLGAAGLNANFGIYFYDSVTQTRHPIFDDPTMWDIFAKPLQARQPPNATSAALDGTLNGTTEIGAVNTYTSTLFTFTPGSIYGVRVMEGFSSEEGFPKDFGTTEFEGHAQLGVAPLQPDGSWLATIPANIPVHLEAIDKFGMSLFAEPVWISSRAGEVRECGGCHENRATTTTFSPGQTMANSVGPTAMYGSTPRAQRMSTTYTIPKVMGVPWDLAVQPIFDAHGCAKSGCHDGTPGPANPSWSIMDPATGQTVFKWTFNLSGTTEPIEINGKSINGSMGFSFSASYLSLVGPDMEAITEGQLTPVGLPSQFDLLPLNAAGSKAIQLLNPPQQFPTFDANTRFMQGVQTHAQEQGFTDLTPDEYYTLILAADMGTNFYSRENNPHDANPGSE